MKQTTNYKLNMPEVNESVDINILNANMEIIDVEMKKNKTVIVDNLTEGGKDKALSAEQGKVLFQSGIERNQELVANLNSKKVQATTNDSLKTNIAKVNDITTDPSIGTTNALAKDILKPKTAYVNGKKVTGTMIDRGSVGKTILYEDLIDLVESAQNGQVLLDLSEGHYNKSEFVVSRPKDDVSGSPGSPYLLKGTMQEGFFGFVESAEIFTGTEIAAAVGISEGVVRFNDVRWIKLAYQGKVIFRPQKPIRQNISWEHINSKGAVFGKQISKNGIIYNVRLHKGALTNPSENEASDRGAMGSEWNRVILPLSINAETGAWRYPEYVEHNIRNWETKLTNEDLGAGGGTERGSWCQEKYKTNSVQAVGRGSGGVENSNAYPYTNPNASYGWTPVLEVII